MRLTCPNCSAGYDVPDRLLSTTGRRMRCARCSAEFRAALPESAPPAEVWPVATPPRDEPAPTLHVPPREAASQHAAPHAAAPAAKRARWKSMLQIAAALVGWIGSLGLAGAGGYLAISERGSIMRVWEPSVRIYRIIGMATPSAAPAAEHPPDHAPSHAPPEHGHSTSDAGAAAATERPEAPATSPPASHRG